MQVIRMLNLRMFSSGGVFIYAFMLGVSSALSVTSPFMSKSKPSMRSSIIFNIHAQQIKHKHK